MLMADNVALIAIMGRALFVFERLPPNSGTLCQPRVTLVAYKDADFRFSNETKGFAVVLGGASRIRSWIQMKSAPIWPPQGLK